MTLSPAITLPVLPLRDIVVFPHMIVPLFVGREKSIKALEAVMAEEKQIILVTQTEAEIEDPDAGALRDWHGWLDLAITEVTRWCRKSAG